MNDFMNFMGFRNMLVEEKIEECLSHVRNGERDIHIDKGDLTDDEVAYVKQEVIRRVNSGRY